MNRDRVGGISFAVFGIIVVLMTTQIPISANLTEPGPRLFPYIAGFGMLFCGVGMALTANSKEKQKPYLTKEGWKRLGVVGAAMVLYYLALEVLGFLISTPFFTFAIILILSSGKKVNKVWAAVIALMITGILYALFKMAFGIFLPSGLLF